MPQFSDNGKWGILRKMRNFSREWKSNYSKNGAILRKMGHAYGKYDVFPKMREFLEDWPVPEEPHFLFSGNWGNLDSGFKNYIC